MVGKPCLHGWRNPQSLVNPAEIVVHEVDRNHVGMVRHLLAKSVRKPSKTAHPHTHI